MLKALILSSVVLLGFPETGWAQTSPGSHNDLLEDARDTFGNSLTNLLTVSFEDGNYSQVIKSGKQLRDLVPRVPTPYLRMLALSQTELKRWEDAEETWFQVYERHPNNHESLYELANAQFQQGYRRKSIRLFNKILDLNPSHRSALYRVGQDYFRQGDYETSRRFLAKAVHHSLTQPNAEATLGLISAIDGDLEESTGWLKRAFGRLELERQLALARDNHLDPLWSNGYMSMVLEDHSLPTDQQELIVYLEQEIEGRKDREEEGFDYIKVKLRVRYFHENPETMKKQIKMLRPVGTDLIDINQFGFTTGMFLGYPSPYE